MLELRSFAETDLTAAGDMALRLWGGEVPDMPVSLRPRIYQYLARYYFVPESAYNYAVCEGGELRAFLMAAPAGHKENTLAEDWILPRLNTVEEQKFFRQYKAYLDANKTAEQEAALSGEMLMLFFASEKKGCGRMILESFDARCRKEGYASTLLWTDETCDFDYYFRNGFEEVCHFPCKASLCGVTYSTWLFRKYFRKDLHS